MTNITITFDKSTRKFSITNTDALDTHNITVYKLDNTDTFVEETIIVVAPGTAVYDYFASTDGFYKIKDTDITEDVVYFVDISIEECLKTITNKVICSTVDCKDLTTFNSMILTSQLLYNVLPDDVTTLYVAGNVLFNGLEIEHLHSANKLFTRLTEYCTSLNEDCTTC
jgi:hypothetical protein